MDVYLNEPPSGTIIAVESPMMAPIANSRGDYLEKPILVVADLITRQDDGTLQVNEIKTSGRAYSESEVATSLQPTFYANALYETTGEEPAVEFTVLVKTKTPKVQKIQAIRTISDFQTLGDIIEAVDQAIEAGSLLPDGVSHQLFGLSVLTGPVGSGLDRGVQVPGIDEALEIEEPAPC